MKHFKHLDIFFLFVFTHSVRLSRNDNMTPFIAKLADRGLKNRIATIQLMNELCLCREDADEIAQEISRGKGAFGHSLPFAVTRSHFPLLFALE